MRSRRPRRLRSPNHVAVVFEPPISVAVTVTVTAATSLTVTVLPDQGRPRQLTDVYLLALAVEHGCRLVTFDRCILVAAMRRASGPSLVVI